MGRVIDLTVASDLDHEQQALLSGKKGTRRAPRRTPAALGYLQKTGGVRENSCLTRRRTKPTQTKQD